MSVLEPWPYNRSTAAASRNETSCSRPSVVQRLVFSRSRYPNIRRHYVRATRAGWPRILVVNRPGADERRDRLLDETSLPPHPRLDRDEYPPAVGRGRGGRGLTRGINPVGWMASGHLRAGPREPVARLVARSEATRAVQRHALPLRVSVAASHNTPPPRRAKVTPGPDWLVLTLCLGMRLPRQEEAFQKRAFREPYKIWVLGPVWKAQRDAWYSRHPLRLCFVCDAGTQCARIELHHVTYERAADPRDEDLVMLCEACHEQVHHYVQEHLDDEDSLRTAHEVLHAERLAEHARCRAQWRATFENWRRARVRRRRGTHTRSTL